MNRRPTAKLSHPRLHAQAWTLLTKRVSAAREPASGFDPRSERLTFDDLAEGYLRDYRANRRRSVGHAERSVRHLRAVFGGRRAIDIDTDHVQTTRTRGSATAPHGPV